MYMKNHTISISIVFWRRERAENSPVPSRRTHSTKNKSNGFVIIAVY